MIYQLILCLVCLVLDTLAAAGVAAQEKDLEIALLRQQLRILERGPDRTDDQDSARNARPCTYWSAGGL